MGTMSQSVHGRVGHDLIGEERQPVSRRPVRGNDDRTPLVALSDDFVELLGLGHGHGGEAKVIDNQKVGQSELFQGLLPGLCCKKVLNSYQISNNIVLHSCPGTSRGPAHHLWTSIFPSASTIVSKYTCRFPSVASRAEIWKRRLRFSFS